MKRILLGAVLAASLTFSGAALAQDVVTAVAPGVAAATDSVQLAAGRRYYAPRYYNPGPRYYSYRPYYYRPYSGYYYGYRSYPRYYYSPYVARSYPYGGYYVPRGRVMVY